MVITPELERKQEKILDIFLQMSITEQFATVGFLHAFAHKNNEKQIEQEYMASTRKKSTKIIQFPTATAR